VGEHGETTDAVLIQGTWDSNVSFVGSGGLPIGNRPGMPFPSKAAFRHDVCRISQYTQTNTRNQVFAAIFHETQEVSWSGSFTVKPLAK
jgi:hypothetical protein